MAENDFLKKASVIIPNQHLICHNKGIPYAPIQVILYWEKKSDAHEGKAIVYPVISQGLQFLATIKGVVELQGMKFKDYSSLVNKKCDRDGLFMNIGITLDGPAEFDRNMQFEAICKNGAMSFYFTDHRTGEQEPESVPLVCELRQ